MNSKANHTNTATNVPAVNRTVRHGLADTINQLKRIMAKLGELVATGAVRGLGFDVDINEYKSQLEALDIHMAPIRKVLERPHSSDIPPEMLEDVKSTLDRYDSFRQKPTKTTLIDLQDQKVEIKRLMENLTAALNAFGFWENVESAAARATAQPRFRTSPPRSGLSRHSASGWEDDADSLQTDFPIDRSEYILEMNGLAGRRPPHTTIKGPHRTTGASYATSQGDRDRPRARLHPVYSTGGQQNFAGDFITPALREEEPSRQPRGQAFLPILSEEEQIDAAFVFSDPETYLNDEDYNSTPPSIPALHHQRYHRNTSLSHVADSEAGPSFTSTRPGNGRIKSNDSYNPPPRFPVPYNPRHPGGAGTSLPPSPSAVESERHQPTLYNLVESPEDMASYSLWSTAQRGAGRRRARNQTHGIGYDEPRSEDDQELYDRVVPHTTPRERSISPTTRRRERLLHPRGN